MLCDKFAFININPPQELLITLIMSLNVGRRS